MTDYTLRDMRLEDIPRIAQMERICFTVPWPEESLMEEYENPLSHWRLMVIGEEIAGYGGMWIVLDEAHVTNVAVLPEYRRRGCGRAIMEELIARAKELGAERMTLEVRVSNNAAKLLYFRLGFMPVGVRKGYYTDNKEDALILWKDEL